MSNNENSNFQKMSTIKNNPNIEQGNASELNKIFNVKKNLYNLQPKKFITQIYYQKSQKNGHEIHKGAFFAVSKNKNIEKPDFIDNKLYYINNQKDKFINNQNYYDSNEKINIFKIVYLTIFLMFILFIFIDFFKMYIKIKNENNLKRNLCIKEFNSNNCNKVSIEDGPIINDYCLEKKKCIETYQTFFHEILINYIKSIIKHSFNNISLLNSIIFIFGMILIIKLLNH